MKLIAPYLTMDPLAGFVAGAIVFFTVLILIYSIGFMRGRQKLGFYLSVVLTLVASLAAVWTNHLILLMIFWGFLGLLLYLLIGYGTQERTPATAKKTFIIIGTSDALMLLGVGLIWKMTGTFSMDQALIPLTSKTAVAAYLCLAAGALAKAGAMPFHTWVPDTAEDAPIPVTAFLPASLDKLLGIYLLARISLDMFVMTPAMNTLLMAIGALTIVAAVMMALIQHDLKRLLGYHAVSQVGYMVLGIGTGTPIGIAGGLFHMLNHAIYKSCLFLSGGAVEQQAGTSDLARLGGLARFMPITFLTLLLASLAISGVPPMNGFASKWMVYQGIISTGREGGGLWMVWLVAAMFGSALTLASFMKLLHAVFLGQQSRELQGKRPAPREASPTLWIPQAILALACVIFGVWAYQVPLTQWIFPALGGQVDFIGLWQPGLATLLILAGLIIGGLVYLLGTIRTARVTGAFVGGEPLKKHPQMRLSGTEFYNTIRELPFLKRCYMLAERKWFDPYEDGRRITFALHDLLGVRHSGRLQTYLTWCLLGLGILLVVLLCCG